MKGLFRILSVQFCMQSVKRLHFESVQCIMNFYLLLTVRRVTTKPNHVQSLGGCILNWWQLRFKSKTTGELKLTNHIICASAHHVQSRVTSCCWVHSTLTGGKSATVQGYRRMTLDTIPYIRQYETHLLKNIVVEFIVTGQSDESTPAAGHGKEYLDSCISPYL